MAGALLVSQLATAVAGAFSSISTGPGLLQALACGASVLGLTLLPVACRLDRPAAAYLDTQRAAHLQRMRELTELKRSAGLVDAMLADHGLYHLEADLRWIDMTSARLLQLRQEISQP